MIYIDIIQSLELIIYLLNKIISLILTILQFLLYEVNKQ